MGRYDDPVAELETVRDLIGDELPYMTHLGIAYANAGRLADAQRVLAELERRAKSGYVPKDQLAALRYALGNERETWRWLGQAIDERHYWLPYLNGNPTMERARGEPEFRRLMRRIGVPDRAL
jgi:hypothetical protein